MDEQKAHEEAYEKAMEEKVRAFHMFVNMRNFLMNGLYVGHNALHLAEIVGFCNAYIATLQKDIPPERLAPKPPQAPAQAPDLKVVKEEPVSEVKQDVEETQS